MASNNVKIIHEGNFEYAIIDNADIGRNGWRNFSGVATAIKPNNTDRSFNVFLSEDDAAILKNAGYNVKTRSSENNPSEPDLHFLEIFLKYDRRYPRLLPKVLQVRPHSAPILIPEDEVYQLDTYEIVRAKIKIRPYDWEYNRKHGRKAMVAKMYVAIYQDEFDQEFYSADTEATPFE